MMRMTMEDFKYWIRRYSLIWNYLSKYDFNHPIEDLLYKKNITSLDINNTWEQYRNYGISSIDKKFLWVYIHIPFCTSICNYCHNNRDKGTQVEVDAYFSELISDIKSKYHLFNGLEIQSIYLWWGTPSLLSSSQLTILVRELKNIFLFKKGIFLNIETTPFSLPKEKLETLSSLGFTRISVGIQSTSHSILHHVNRPWDYEYTLRTLQNIKNFPHIELNLDFIAWLPWETQDDIQKNILLIKEIHPNTVFVYRYKPHDKTPFYEWWWRYWYSDFQKIEEGHTLMTSYLSNIWFFPVEWNDECFSSSLKNKLNVHDFNYFNYQNSVISFWKYSEWHIFWKLFYRCLKFEGDKSVYEWYFSSIIDEKIRYVFNMLTLYKFLSKSQYYNIFSTHIIDDFPTEIDILIKMNKFVEIDDRYILQFKNKIETNVFLTLFFRHYFSLFDTIL